MKSKQITFESQYASKLQGDDNDRNQEVIYYKKERLHKDTNFHLKMILIACTSSIILILVTLLVAS